MSLVCSTMVNTTHIFLGGGRAPQVTAESWMYDRVRESWNQLPNMLQVRQGAGCGVSGKHVVVFGGYDGTDDWINLTEIFNLDSWSWFQGQLTPYQFTSHNILQYGMDYLLAFGGTIVNDTHTEDTDAILEYDLDVMGWVQRGWRLEAQASRVLCLWLYHRIWLIAKHGLWANQMILLAFSDKHYRATTMQWIK